MKEKLYFQSKDTAFNLLHGNTLDLLPRLNQEFDMIFADPPYFLSNNSLNGQIRLVYKG